MTTTTSTHARPRSTHPEPNGARHSTAQHSTAQPGAALHADAQHDRAQNIDVAAIDAALVRITETATELARITESAAESSRRSNVAEIIVTSLIREFTMIVGFVVRLDQHLVGGAAAEFRTVVGWNPDDDQRSELCFGDPAACV